MPIDPYAALNAMLRAEAARHSPPVRRTPERPASAPRPTGPEATATAAGREEEPEAGAGPGPATPAA
ncbi:hypothetical protein ABZW32_04135 [Streptomyces sp. NPDC004667]|uniref:hypothetical protein n=1 Tax=Streptomyces sp. NPDC004667 TaxID=3154285 RepID=UPI0033B631D8